MEKNSYKLSCTLLGHTEDVRAIAAFENGTVVSASRDKTARVWRPNRDEVDYLLSGILKGHTNFVSSICVLNPTEHCSKSLIITGSNDHHICIYQLGEEEPLRKIKAHEDTVCSLRTGVEAGTFLSSSWDLSAKLWNLDNLDEATLILRGHSLAVWCVADLPNKTIVTGSADKSLVIWTRKGAKLHTLEGHTDCVRDIASIKYDEFLSCSNDATIRHWNSVNGACLRTYYGHENYIYCISATLTGDLVVTSGEDKTIRVWKKGEIDQTIYLPTSSVWCVDLLSNNDIVAGSSDGIVRVFSADPERWANPEILQVWEQLTLEDRKKSQKELGNNIKIDELPTLLELNKPGNRDGQTKMINENGKAIAYSWSQSDQQWIKIGDIVGAADGNSSKQLYNGKEYDFVFSVDIQDGVPPLKLPYNKTEDPWHAAQKFIHDNELSQMFLDQVANFIVKNSGGSETFTSNAQFADPFTGGSRYIPGSALPNFDNTQVTSTISHADPFTGSNRYIPGSNFSNSQINQAPSRLPSEVSTPSYIPHTVYLKLEQANYVAVLEKLKEFNSKQGESLQQLSQDQLESVVNLAKGEIQPNAQIMTTLWTLLNWPTEYVFPALDVTRLAVLHKNANNFIASEQLMPVIERHTANNAITANQMLTFRLLANMFNHEKGQNFGLQHIDDIFQALQGLSSVGSKHNQVAISTYMLNLVVALIKINRISAHTKVLNALMTIIPHLMESEAIFRSLVALGTLLAATPHLEIRKELINMVKESQNMIDLLNKFSMTVSMQDPHGKLSKCSKQILELII